MARTNSRRVSCQFAGALWVDSQYGEPDERQTLSGAAACLKIRSKSWAHSSHSKTEKVECFDQGMPHGRDWWGDGGFARLRPQGIGRGHAADGEVGGV